MNEPGKRISDPRHGHEDFENVLADVLRPAYREFVAGGYLKGPDRFGLYEEKGFRTPTGKVELKPSAARKFHLKPFPEFSGLPDPDDPDYPLILISAKSRYYLLSVRRWV